MFIDDLAGRLANRVQLTMDGLKVYLEAVEGAFGADIDYAQLIKIYGATQEETRYSPAECIGCESKIIQGKPNMKHVSTSYVAPAPPTGSAHSAAPLPRARHRPAASISTRLRSSNSLFRWETPKFLLRSSFRGIWSQRSARTPPRPD